jgi:cobalt/nickel transport system permease protein
MISGSKKRNNFIERSIMGALFFLKDAVLCEEHALRKGFLQSLDPRIKAATILMFLLTVVSLKSVVAIGGLYCVCLALFLLRTWVFIPLFTLLIAIPALFAFVTPGDTLCAVHFLGRELIVTRQGSSGALLFVVRVATSVSFAVLLSLTTRHAELLKVLRIFGVPQIFVLTVSMCYRYLYLFAVTVENVFMGIKSRVGVVSGHRKGQRVVAWNIANTWSRTAQMSENVYSAMLSRGYTGESRLLNSFRAGIKDWVWFLAVTVICLGLFFIKHTV